MRAHTSPTVNTCSPPSSLSSTLSDLASTKEKAPSRSALRRDTMLIARPCSRIAGISRALRSSASRSPTPAARSRQWWTTSSIASIRPPPLGGRRGARAVASWRGL